MEAHGRRSPRRSARLSGLALLAACAAIAAAGCGGSGPTPETIYRTYPPSTAGPTATGSGVASTPTSALTAGATATASATATPTPTPTPTTTPVAAAPSVSSTTDTSSAPDNRWQVTFRKPVISGVGPAALTAMNDSIATRVSAYISSFNGTPLPVVAAGDGPSTLKGDFSVALASPSLLSLRFTIETYVTGAARPATEAASINFDVASGAVIQFGDLFTGTAAALPVLKTQAQAKLVALLGADLVWPASVTMADFGQGWVFTSGGLELTWSQGAIASMAAGTPKISIAWPALSSVIAPAGPAGGFVQ